MCGQDLCWVVCNCVVFWVVQESSLLCLCFFFVEKYQKNVRILEVDVDVEQFGGCFIYSVFVFGLCGVEVVQVDDGVYLYMIQQILVGVNYCLGCEQFEGKDVGQCIGQVDLYQLLGVKGGLGLYYVVQFEIVEDVMYGSGVDVLLCYVVEYCQCQVIEYESYYYRGSEQVGVELFEVQVIQDVSDGCSFDGEFCEEFYVQYGQVGFCQFNQVKGFQVVVKVFVCCVVSEVVGLVVLLYELCLGQCE